MNLCCKMLYISDAYDGSVLYRQQKLVKEKLNNVYSCTHSTIHIQCIELCKRVSAIPDPVNIVVTRTSISLTLTRVLIVVVLWFPRQEYWSGLPFPSPGDSNPGIEPHGSCIWQGDYLPLSHLGSPQTHMLYYTLNIVMTAPGQLLHSQSFDSEEKTGFDTGYCNKWRLPRWC